MIAENSVANTGRSDLSLERQSVKPLNQIGQFSQYIKEKLTPIGAAEKISGRLLNSQSSVDEKNSVIRTSVKDVPIKLHPLVASKFEMPKAHFS